MPGILEDYLNSSSSNHDTTANTTLNGQQILEENSNFQPTHEEILEYAETVLELRPDETEQLLWIAEEGIKAPLPEGWKPVTTEKGDLYYFNFNSGESMWEHPCDDYYKELAVKERKKRDSSQKKKLTKKREKDKGKERDRQDARDLKPLKGVSSQQSKLKPLKLKSSKSNLDENEERDFIRSLRSSTEVEEKIEPPVERKPLSKSLSNEFDDLLKSTSSDTEQLGSDASSSSDDSDFDILPGKKKAQHASKNDKVQGKSQVKKQSSLRSSRELQIPNGTSSRNSKSSIDRKKSVTFEDNPINNIVSDSFDDFDSKSHTPNLFTKQASGNDDQDQDQDKNKQSTASLTNNENINLDDVNLNFDIVQSQNKPKPEIRSSTKNENNSDNNISVDFEKFGQSLGESINSSSSNRSTPQQVMDRPVANPTTVEFNKRNQTSKELELLELKLENEKRVKITDLENKIKAQEEKEAQLLTLKLKEAENNVAEIEKELSKQRFEFVRNKEDKINIEKNQLAAEIERAIDQHRAQIEEEKECKLEKLQQELDRKYKSIEKDTESDYSLKIKQLNLKFETKIKDQEKMLLSEFEEKSEKRKDSNLKNLEILNSQKDDLEAQLAGQLKRLDEQHSREVDQLNDSNFENIQKFKSDMNRDFKELIRKLETENDEELDKRKEALKTQNSLFIDTLREKLSISRIQLETEKSALQSKIESIKNEEALFDKKEKEFRDKMANLETEFSAMTKSQEKILHEKIVELAEKKTILEDQVNDRKLTNENYKRDNERLKIENKEWLLKLDKFKEDYLRRAHEQDISEIRQVSESLKETRKREAQSLGSSGFNSTSQFGTNSRESAAGIDATHEEILTRDSKVKFELQKLSESNDSDIGSENENCHHSTRADNEVASYLDQQDNKMISKLNYLESKIEKVINIVSHTPPPNMTTSLNFPVHAGSGFSSARSEQNLLPPSKGNKGPGSGGSHNHQQSLHARSTSYDESLLNHSHGHMTNTEHLDYKPPLPKVPLITQLNNGPVNSPFDKLDSELSARHKHLEQYLSEQNPWWFENSNHFDYQSQGCGPVGDFRPISQHPFEIESLTAKELIQRRVSLMLNNSNNHNNNKVGQHATASNPINISNSPGRSRTQSLNGNNNSTANTNYVNTMYRSGQNTPKRGSFGGCPPVAL